MLTTFQRTQSNVKNDIKSKIISPRDNKRRICKIEIQNGWNTQVVQVLCEDRDCRFHFKASAISRISNAIELSHGWILKKIKYQDPGFYSRLFDKSEYGLFKLPPGRAKVGVKRNKLPGAPRLYVLYNINSNRV